MKLKRKVIKISTNSRGVIIPAQIARALNVQIGDEVELILKEEDKDEN